MIFEQNLRRDTQKVRLLAYLVQFLSNLRGKKSCCTTSWRRKATKFGEQVWKDMMLPPTKFGGDCPNIMFAG